MPGILVNTQFSKSRLSEVSFYLQSGVYLLLVLLVMNFTGVYKSLDREDGFIELAGAAFLLFASIMLFVTTFQYKKLTQKRDYKFWLFLSAAIAFFWASGEEISWGQHMLGTETPEWLGKINGQNETNLHNINKKFFDRTLERLMVLLSLITAIFHFRGKESFLGFKLPAYPLNLAFLLIPIFRKHQSFDLDVWYINFVIFWGYPVVAIARKNFRMLFMSVLFAITTITVLHYHHNFHATFNVSNFFHEVRETMFAIMAFTYAVLLWQDVKENEGNLMGKSSSDKLDLGSGQGSVA